MLTNPPPPSLSATRVDAKRKVHYFLSYAHEDAGLKDDLLRRLEPLFTIAKNYSFVGWQDGDIRLDEHWHLAIQRAIKNCGFGLLLVSSRFLASRYIGEYELPHFVADDALECSAMANYGRGNWREIARGADIEAAPPLGPDWRIGDPHPLRFARRRFMPLAGFRSWFPSEQTIRTGSLKCGSMRARCDRCSGTAALASCPCSCCVNQ
jgi:hypothetical protein